MDTNIVYIKCLSAPILKNICKWLILGVFYKKAVQNSQDKSS